MLKDRESNFPTLFTLGPQFFDPETYGYEAFPQILNGRARPAAVFENITLKDYQLGRFAFDTLQDLLVFPYSYADQFSNTQRALFDAMINHWTQKIAIGGEGLLIGIMFGENDIHPISLEAETMQRIAVRKTISSVSSDIGSFTIDRFNLEKGIALLQDHEYYNRTDTLYRQRECLQALRHVGGQILKDFLPYPSNSLATELFQATCQYDIFAQLPLMEVQRLRELKVGDVFTKTTQHALEDLGKGINMLTPILSLIRRGDLDKTDLGRSLKNVFH